MRTFNALPDSPLTFEQVESLRESDQIQFIQGIMWMSGSMAGLDSNDTEVTENVVLSTESKTVNLWFDKGTGWVIEEEIEHEDGDEPREVGFEAYTAASGMAAEAMHEAFESDHETENVRESDGGSR